MFPQPVLSRATSIAPNSNPPCEFEPLALVVEPIVELTQWRVNVVEARKVKKQAVQYYLHITTSSTCWTVERRYSAIRDFRKKILRLLKAKNSRACTGACQHLSQIAHEEFPGKKVFCNRNNRDLIDEHEKKLHKFVQFIFVVYHNTSTSLANICEMQRCAVNELIRTFFQEGSIPCRRSPLSSNQESDTQQCQYLLSPSINYELQIQFV